jgi:hypothetical protein
VADGSERPIFFCRRWDQLGGRLLALTNTIAVARDFGCEFRFAWPKGAQPYIADPTPLLARSFLERFEFTEEDLRGRTVLPEGEILFRDRADVHERLAGLNEQVLVEIQHPFDIVRPRDDDPAQAARRFIDAFGSIGWSDDAGRLVDFAFAWNAGEAISALHVRAGDIVSGLYRHSMYYGKYVPLAYVTHAAEALSRGPGRLLVLSDNELLLTWLRCRFDSIVTAAEIVPGYDQLPVILRAFADILLMSRCDSLYGPSDSAFSTLAALIGGRRVIPASRLVPPGEEGTVLSSGIRRAETDTAELPFLRPLVARDIVWYLDVFGDGVPLRGQLDLARRAAALDPDSMCVTARLAHLSALHGDRQEALAAAAAALRMSRGVEGNPDVLVESLATSVAVECFELVLGRRHRGRLDALRRRATPENRRATIRSALEGLCSSIQLVRRTQPYEFWNHPVAENLRDLVGMVEWLSEADDSVLSAIGGRSVSWDGTAVDMGLFRAPNPGGAHHDEATIFPAVVRNLDRAVIHLSQAIGSVMTPVREERSAVIRGYADQVTVSQTGVRWLRGWVAENVEREGRLVGGLALVTSADFSGGAAPTLSLPDFDAIVGPTAGSAIGFRMPVPRGLTREGVGAAGLRFFGVARDGRAGELQPG